MEPFRADDFHGLGWLLGYSEGFGSFGGSEDDLEQTSIDLFLSSLKDVRPQCEAIGLRVCVVHIDEIIRRLASGKAVKRKDLIPLTKELHDNFKRELGVTKFFRLSSDTQHYYGVVNAFGPEVAKAFSSSEYDIKEAGNCLAVSRATAAVFHAMRVLEHGLHALANQFSVPFEHKTWGEIIERIEKAIRDIGKQPDKPPNWKDEEQFYSEAAAQFMHFKNAWRNYTAHARFKYTETEAESIYRHVRDFMQHLAKRLKEPTP